MWNSGWDDIFLNNEWGKCADNSVVRFVARNYGSISNKSKINILEVGCGPGANLIYLAEEGYNTFGIDGSSVALERAKSRLAQKNLQCQLDLGDISQLPYEDNSIDCIIDCECIYANSLSSSVAILSELKRVLKKDGLFFSMTFSDKTYGYNKGEPYNNEQNTFINLSEGAFHSGYGVIRFTTKDEIDALYGSIFDVYNVETLSRTINNSKNIVDEWLISCRHQ